MKKDSTDKEVKNQDLTQALDEKAKELQKVEKFGISLDILEKFAA